MDFYERGQETKRSQRRIKMRAEKENYNKKGKISLMDFLERLESSQFSLFS